MGKMHEKYGIFFKLAEFYDNLLSDRILTAFT